MKTILGKMSHQVDQHLIALHARERLRPWVRQTSTGRALATFFLLAFVCSWLVAIPLALQAQGVLPPSLPMSLHYLTAFGPLTAALLVTARYSGGRGLHRLFRQILCWRVPAGWWLVAFSPLLFYLIVLAVLWLRRGQPQDLTALGRLKFLPDLGPAAVPFWVATFGLGEETGWRGYALPRLQRRYTPLTATLIIWVLWALWHLPFFFYTYDVAVLPGFLPGLLAGAIVFTWIYNGTGSILIAAVWHGLFNLTTACASCGDGIGTVAVSTFVMGLAVVLLAFRKSLLQTRQATSGGGLEKEALGW